MKMITYKILKRLEVISRYTGVYGNNHLGKMS